MHVTGRFCLISTTNWPYNGPSVRGWAIQLSFLQNKSFMVRF